MLLNPDLEDTILSYTFGITTSNACRDFVRTFGEPVYYYRGIFQLQRPSNRPVERGAVLRHYDGPFLAHVLCETAGGFERLAEFESLPSREQLGSLNWGAWGV